MRKTAQKAFTMIELLVVIAVIGVMATAVLSAINPLEQINKGNDTGYRSDSEQLLSAVDRYYASLGYFPWQYGAADKANLNVNFMTVNELNTDTDFLNKLESTQEIKHGFTLRLLDTKRENVNVMYNSESDSPTMYTCFRPSSKSFMTEAGNRCTNTTPAAGTPFGPGDEGVACNGDVAADSTCAADKACMICLP